MTTIDIEALTKDERSLLLYAESCCVDYGGLLESARMNDADTAALRKFADAGILKFGRIPYRALEMLANRKTHWVTFTDEAWQLAHELRRRRAAKVSASRKLVDEVLAEKAAD